MSNDAQAATPVAWAPAEPLTAYTATRVYAGRTRPGRAAELGFRQSGELRVVLVEEGARVESGQPLARLDSDYLQSTLSQFEADVALARANLQSLEADAGLAVATEARFRSLRETGHVSAQSYDEARMALAASGARVAVAEAALARAQAAREAAVIALEDATLNSPFAGIIQTRHRDEGSQLAPGEPVLRLIESGRMEVDVGIPELVASTLDPGTSYPILWNGQHFEASLRTVLPEVDETTRTRRAVFLLNDGPLPLGTVVELALNQSVDVAGYWLPLTALVEADRGLWGLFVINDEDVLERRLVEIVHMESGRAYVRGTLAPGERVIQTGVQRLVAGQSVSAAR